MLSSLCILPPLQRTNQDFHTVPNLAHLYDLIANDVSEVGQISIRSSPLVLENRHSCAPSPLHFNADCQRHSAAGW